MSEGRNRVLPGFRLALGFTLVYLLVIIVAPLSTIFLKSATLTWHDFWATIMARRTIAACRLSFGASFAAALINSVFGTIVAWTVVRYEFPARGVIDAVVDLPFALPTSVAGITLTALYASNGSGAGLRRGESRLPMLPRASSWP
jgi:sulfate transport system permease protein